MIDWNIRVGDLAVVASVLAGWGVGIIRSSSNMKMMIRDIDELKDIAKTTSTVLTNLAVQKERLDAQGQRLNTIDQHIDDLRNGRGYISDRHGKGVDREY